jgi:hypothetical protein
MFHFARVKLYFVFCLLLCIMLQSCSRDSTGSSVVDQPNIEYLYASQCNLSSTNRPEGCAPNAPYLIGKYKVGHVYLHIPSQHLQQPVETVRDVPRASHTVCWPSLNKVLKGCTTRIKVYMMPGSLPGSVRVPHMTKEERLGELTETLTGPFQIEGTRVDEYRRRNGAGPVYSFRAEDGLRITQCWRVGRCIVSIWDHHGLSIRYEFGIELVGDWQEIDAEVESLVASFIVQTDSD